MKRLMPNAPCVSILGETTELRNESVVKTTTNFIASGFGSCSFRLMPTSAFRKQSFHALVEVNTLSQSRTFVNFVERVRQASGNSCVDRVLSLFGESRLSINVELLIVVGD